MERTCTAALPPPAGEAKLFRHLWTRTGFSSRARGSEGAARRDSASRARRPLWPAARYREEMSLSSFAGTVTFPGAPHAPAVRFPSFERRLTCSEGAASPAARLGAVTAGAIGCDDEQGVAMNLFLRRLVDIAWGLAWAEATWGIARAACACLDRRHRCIGDVRTAFGSSLAGRRYRASAASSGSPALHHGARSRRRESCVGWLDCARGLTGALLPPGFGPLTGSSRPRAAAMLLGCSETSLSVRKARPDGTGAAARP